MRKRKMALWLVIVLVCNLISGLSVYSESSEPSITSESLVQELPNGMNGITDISTLSNITELSMLPLENTGDYFVVRYENGTREIRKRSISLIQALDSETEPVPSTEDLVDLYEEKMDVSYAEPVLIYSITESESASIPQDNDYIQGKLWGFDAVKAQLTYEKIDSSSLSSVVVAVVDTGVNYNHPDLNDAIYGQGKDLVGVGDSDPMDENSHGTHVAGIIAAEANTQDSIGVAPGVKIMPVRVLNNAGSGTSLDVAEGIKWAADNGAQIINLSLGGAESSEISLAVTYATDRGILVIAAAGNGAGAFPTDNFGIDLAETGVNTKPLLYPAALTNVLSVGSVGKNGSTYRVSNFSCSGAELDVSAPGEVIYSTNFLGTGTIPYSGTSMATPHVSALAALLKAQDSTRTRSWIMDRIKTTAQSGVYDDPVYGGNQQFYGTGLIDCNKALGLISNAIGSVGEIDSRTFASGPISLTEEVAGNWKLIMDPAIRLDLPNGYQWESVPSPVLSGGFSGCAAIAVSTGSSSIILTPEYSSATTASPGVITLTGAVIRANPETVLSDVNISFSGKSVPTEIIKAAGYQGNYLSSMSFGGGIAMPAFGRAVSNYACSVESGTTTAAFTATAENPSATMTVNGTPYTSGTISSFNLSLGMNTFSVAVTGPGGIRTYQIAIERQSAFIAQPAPSGGGGGGGGGSGGGSGAYMSPVSVSGITKIELPALTIELPAGVSASDFTLKTSMTDFVGLKFPEGTRVISDYWSIQPEGASYKKPFKISMAYSASKVDTSKESISINWLNEKTKEWFGLENISVGGGMVSGMTEKQGIFALLVKPKIEEPPVPTQVIPDDVPAQNLADIKGHWAEQSIQKLIDLKAISGNPDGTFQPDKRVTRAEFITMLVKALSLKGSTDRTFNDLQGHWASEVVKIAIANGVVNGYSDGTVKPDDDITREQMALMIVNAKKFIIEESDRTFADSNVISEWSRPAVQTAVRFGIISGYQDNTFKPLNLATKAEAVSMIARCLN